MYKHSKQISIGGIPAANAKAALIMIHGRGASADGIMQLASRLNVKDMALYAPQATNNSWYPYSFMAPVQENEPALSSALDVIDHVVDQIIADGISEDKIYFLGFSQGACLTLEYLARNAKRFGGAVAFTGGLIGEELELKNYTGNFEGTPVLITTGDPDMHVPLSRVNESVDVLKGLNANVTLKVYKGKPHTISFEELSLANEYVFL
ncbi:alpha/beta hydrolase [Mucilaginibacter sp.]|jgi:phospholipase/carboxylesterase|uniref:alpha/beta hydrolase n=1 Tax=Mucilaginibacter sp. TaxID=1882438 RepID=UPI0035656393